MFDQDAPLAAHTVAKIVELFGIAIIAWVLPPHGRAAAGLNRIL